MPKRKRVCEPDIVYRVSALCHGGSDYFSSGEARDIFTQVLSRTAAKFRFELISHSVSDNRVVLEMKTLQGGESISKIMQYLLSRTAEKYNRMHGLTGPFWNGRYRDEILSAPWLNANTGIPA